LIVQTTIVHIVPLILLAISIFYLALLYVAPQPLALRSDIDPHTIEEPAS
jgi:hypothetical protein